jgi:uncharacterized protein YqeY
MSLKDRIQDDMKSAMRARDKERLAVIRLILAAIKQREVDERITLTDTQVISVLERMLKQRRESITQYQAASRDDLAAKEAFEVSVIQTYMPEALNDAEIDSIINSAIAATGAHSIRDMGKVMALIKDQVQGRADMAVISARIKARLSR